MKNGKLLLDVIRGDAETKLAQVAASFLGCQMEG